MELAGLRALPLESWAIPTAKTTGTLHAQLYQALGEVYEKDSSGKTTLLSRPRYPNRYLPYKRDYDAVMPQVG
jgi:hypothetical protein